MTQAEKTLTVHSIESFGTHDGPGIRLVVFLQGCNLQCLYCQNPDTMEMKGGTPTEIEALVKRARNMKTYFGDDGGVTVSGGEPMLQSKALIPFFEALKAEGIHTNIDTNGVVRTPEALQLISGLSDLVMFDVKSTTDKGFKTLTGVSRLQAMLSNVKLREASQLPFWLRYVLVPGFTDKERDLEWLIEQFSGMNYLDRFEILPYHKLGQYKWEALGMDYQLMDVAENTPEQLEIVEQKLTPYFKKVIIK
ncbi:pyruvate formate-lyase-activating protein [Sunxiuqinia rutila]|uniref:pyruvate formate-lyase-activating protein n=1 Tax=Sunxiuqinia rutila TaxID=1397841 RepID=UPI003D3658DD